MQNGKSISIYLDFENIKKLEWIEKILGKNKSKVIGDMIADGYNGLNNMNDLFLDEQKTQLNKKLDLNKLLNALSNEIDELKNDLNKNR